MTVSEATRTGATALPRRRSRHRRLFFLLALLAVSIVAWVFIHRARENDALLYAVVDGDARAVHRALASGADPNLRLPLLHSDSGPFNLLQWLRTLLQGKASSTPNNQRSMLMVAASLGNGPICSDRKSVV